MTEIKCIIERFDELICDKASKFETDTLKHKLNDFLLVDTFETHQEDALSKIEHIQAQMNDVRAKMKQYKTTLTESITGSLQNVSSTLEENVTKLLDDNFVTNKVVTDIQEKINQKADKKRFDKMLKIFLKQIEILSVLFIEKLRIETEEYEEPIQTRKSQQIYLLKQSVNLQKWISGLKTFNPFMNTDDSKFISSIKPLSATPKELVNLKQKVDVEVGDISKVISTIPRSASKFPTPSHADFIKLKNESLFVSSMLPDKDLYQKTYFGNRLACKKFSLDQPVEKPTTKDIVHKRDISSTSKINTFDMSNTSMYSLNNPYMKQRRKYNLSVRKFYDKELDEEDHSFLKNPQFKKLK